MPELTIPMRPRRLRRLLAAVVLGWTLAAGLTTCAPPASAVGVEVAR